MAVLQRLGRDDWAVPFSAPLSVVVIGKTTCEHCKEWAAELDAFLAETDEFDDVVFAKIDLDTPGLVPLKRAHPWVSELSDLPHTSIWQAGEKRKEFLGGGIDRLVNRLRRFVG